jgi:uncharacterized protein (DUF1778 family)
MSSTSATARLEARISTELHAMLRRAAEIEGRTVTGYVITAIQAAAQQTIERGQIIHLAMADQEAFAQALLNPPSVAPAMVRGFARRRALLGATAD